MIKYVLAGLLVWGLGFSLIANLAKSNAVTAAPQPKSEEFNPQAAFTNQSAIVRMHDLSDGRFFCSAVIINSTTAFTAAHCVRAADTFEIRGSNRVSVGATATAAGINDRGDVAVLKGDFSKFRSLIADTDPRIILGNIESDKRKIITCGYPYGGSLLCVPVTKRRMLQFFIGGQGYLYPGMSGGPVIDVATGHVIAVNSAVTDSEVMLAPLIEIYAATETTP